MVGGLFPYVRLVDRHKVLTPRFGATTYELLCITEETRVRESLMSVGNNASILPSIFRMEVYSLDGS
jgi:hypothetical protein